MKHCFFLFVVFTAALLTACNPYPRKSVRMNDALEQAKAVYGDGSLEIEVDTVLFIPGLSEAPAYFAGKRQYGKAALAALLNGYTEKDFDKEAAMLSFKEAEHYGELAQDSLTVARAEYWMGKMLYEEGREGEALSMFKASYDNIGNKNNDRIAVENGLAVTYMLLHQFDSAEIYLQNGFVYAQKNHSDKLERKTLNNLAVLYRIQGKYAKALDYIKTILSKPNLDDSEKALAFLNYGKTFMAEGEVDSAALYFQHLEQFLTTIQIKNIVKVTVYGALLNFAESRGDLSSALQYREQHEDALYEVMQQRQEQAVYRIQKQYDYEALRNRLNKKNIQRHKIILTSSILLLALTIIILILQHQHKQMLKEEEEMKRQLCAMKQSLQQRVELSVIDNMVASRLRTVLVAHRTVNRVNDPKKEWRPLILSVMAGKETMFEAALEIIETIYPDLYSGILKKYPYLSETEAKVCVLSCFNLSNSEIAVFLDLKTNTVNQTRTTLRKKLDLNTENLNKQLRKLVSK